MARSIVLLPSWLVIVGLSASLAWADARRSPLHGSLVPGPYGVGFTTMAMADPTRPQAPSVRSRAMVVHLWYPAGETGAAPMTFADAMVAHMQEQPVEELERRNADVRRFMSQFGPVSDDAWAALLKTPSLARRGAAPAAGRFPLVIGQLRPLSTTITNEYLASHGYVVAMTHGVPTEDPADGGAGLEIGYRDMEFAVPELRKLPYVDPVALAALGFSGAGFSQILLAMRHPDVLAVCDLESAIFDDRMMWPLSRGWGYDVGGLRVPFLHTYSVPLSKLESRIADFENMRYSTRYRYLVDAPSIHHWDFATEGMAASTVLRNRGDHSERLRQAFETTNRYVLAFFNAYVKKDAKELAFLRRDPAANGAPAGLASIRELSGVQPAPTIQGFEELLVRDGAARAMQVFDSAHRTDPQASLFRETPLNALGYRLLRRQKPAEAIAVFRKAVELFPNSTNPYDSLSEGLEASGDPAAAREIALKGLEVLAKEDLPDARRQQLRELLEGRVRRIGDR